ncbi:MarR family transcriptional regulator [Pseudonocardia sp.]|uniref:MarR family winged helix-turn-helix transcriptional regulator n=1 Tax=Pseudonocardia sp. TaxID=60912 RepID=UPI002602FB7F|nr:MarR family transcriptional regulator [Pseudonocardia sp.]
MPEEPEESLAEAFWAVTRELRHRSRDALAPWAVTPSQSRALWILLRHGTMRLRDLAEHLRIAPRSATEVVDDLEARGLVERGPDPEDRRATLVHLTDQGREIGAAVRAARSADAEGFFGRLSDADRADLARILRTLRR